MTPETRRSALKRTYTLDTLRTPSLDLKSGCILRRGGGGEVVDDRERDVQRGERKIKRFCRVTLDILAPTPSPCNLRACWEKQQGILGKTGGGLFFKNINNICVYVCKADRRAHVFKHKLFFYYYY